MAWLQRLIALCFLIFGVLALVQCARRGTPSGGPKDETPPELLKSEPDNMTTNFSPQKIRLYFDEFVKLDDVQNQLIVSPPLEYNPDITPQGSTRKYIEIELKDTLKENTTYTLNFGQSIVDNNEGNPNSFLSYVFSTGDYIDSLSLSGSIMDAFDKKPDNFVSVMLYEIDTAYTDSTIYNKLPNYITNTLDSLTTFELRNLKAGEYALVAIKDEGKNNLFDQKTDKIAYLEETITIPTDTSFVLTLFKEFPDFSMAVPNYAASNKIMFGYSGNHEDIEIKPLTVLPDTISTLIAKDPERDTLNFWFTPFEADSIVFEARNSTVDFIDTFTVKTRKLGPDSLLISASHRGNINFEDQFYLDANIPLMRVDTSGMSMLNKDSVAVDFSTVLDKEENKILFNFEKESNQTYYLTILPDMISDFFQESNDTLNYRLSTGSPADYGNVRFNIAGDIPYPIILQLTNEKGETQREIIAEEPRRFEFNSLEPGNYMLRLIYDSNENGIWDTGSFLEKIQPEKVIYYPQTLEVRANWELEQVFTIEN